MGKIKKNDDKSSLIKVIIIMLLMAMLAMVVVLAKSMHVKTMLYRNYLESKAINKLIIEDNIIYVLRNNSLETYNFSGTLLATSEVSDVYKNFIKIGNEMFLISYDCINKIEYQSS